MILIIIQDITGATGAVVTGTATATDTGGVIAAAIEAAVVTTVVAPAAEVAPTAAAAEAAGVDASATRGGWPVQRAGTRVPALCSIEPRLAICRTWRRSGNRQSAAGLS